MRRIPREAERIAERLADRLAHDPAIVKPFEIDKERWKLKLREQMAEVEKHAHRAIGRGATQTFYDQVVEKRIRYSKNPATESLRDVEAIKRALKRQNQMVQVQTDTGEYVAKPLRGCTPLEFDALAEYHRQKERGHGRSAGFYERLAMQMRLAGLADDDPLAKLLAM